MQQAWRSLSDSSSTMAPRSTGLPSSSSSAAFASRRFSRPPTFARHVASAPSQTLSRTVQSRATRTSWKTVAMPRSWAAFGLRSWTSEPATSTRPSRARAPR